MHVALRRPWHRSQKADAPSALPAAVADARSELPVAGHRPTGLRSAMERRLGDECDRGWRRRRLGTLASASVVDVVGMLQTSEVHEINVNATFNEIINNTDK